MTERPQIDNYNKKATIPPMRYTQIIAQSWQLTLENKKLIWFAFIPSFIGVLVFILEILWQYLILSEEFGYVESGYLWSTLGDVFELLSNNRLLGIGIFLIAFGALFYFLFPAWIHSTLILGVKQRFEDPEKKFSLRQKIIEGFEYFLQIFEFKAVMSPFELMTITLFSLTLYRYYHGAIFNFIFPALIFYTIVALIIGLFLTFTPYFIVIENMSFWNAIKKSIGLVFVNMGNTVGLYLLMLLINIRVIVNVVVIFGVPAMLFGLTTYFTGTGYLGLFLSLAVLVSIGLIGLAAYLNAVLEVFAVAFWERAFRDLRVEQKRLETPVAAAENESEN